MAKLKSLAVYFDTDVGTIAGKNRDETLANFLNLVSFDLSLFDRAFSDLLPSKHIRSREPMDPTRRRSRIISSC